MKGIVFIVKVMFYLLILKFNSKSDILFIINFKINNKSDILFINFKN